MNVEVLETKRDECYVIGDDNKIRKVTKTNQDGSFRDVFEEENKLEQLKKEKNGLKKAIERYGKKTRDTYGKIWFTSVIAMGVVILTAYIVGVVTSLELAVANVKEVLGPNLFFVGAGLMATVLNAIDNLVYKIPKKKKISELEYRINETIDSLVMLKRHDNIREENLSKRVISEEATELLNNACQIDEDARAIAIANNYRILRQVVTEKTGDNELGEKGKTYSLRR